MHHFTIGPIRLQLLPALQRPRKWLYGGDWCQSEGRNRNTGHTLRHLHTGRTLASRLTRGTAPEGEGGGECFVGSCVLGVLPDD